MWLGTVALCAYMVGGVEGNNECHTLHRIEAQTYQACLTAAHRYIEQNNDVYAGMARSSTGGKLDWRIKCYPKTGGFSIARN